MKTLHLEQGSPEWHAHRATHFNASDAPAMMGCSPYKTRNQLLHELHTGFTPDVDAATQRRFDDGHRFEALARPLAEKIVGEDLYPVVGTEGELSASFDGLTMAEDIALEHKSLNAELRACIDDDMTLPLQYRVQMEQQLLVSGAERVLFMASKWNGDSLAEERHCWYLPDLELRAQIVAGWAQFAQDLAAYVAPAAAEPVAVGKTPESLPALRIEVNGAVTASNLPQYRDHALAVFAAINRDLKSDQDFADADKTVKWCADIEDRLKAAKEHALSQTESIDSLFKTIDDITAEARRTRLELFNLVKARKDARRLEIVSGAGRAMAEHLVSVDRRLGGRYMPPQIADFAGAIRGLKSFESMQNAVDTLLANAKVAANEQADRIQANLDTIKAADRAVLFPDLGALVLKAPEDLAAVIAHRVSEHEKAVQAAKDKADAAAAAAAAAAPAPAAAEVAEVLHLPVPTKIPRLRAAPAPAVQVAPTLTLGQIGTRLGFTLPAAFIADCLGIQGQRVKAAVMYHEADFDHVCEALIAHIEAVAIPAA